MIRQYDLVERVRAYDPSVDEDLLNRAYVYAMRMHGSQKRASGDPYFSHPIEVAGILTDMKLDGDTIATALLHDTIEDTAATLGDIDRIFGKNIGRLVDGVTKLTRLELQSDRTKDAENFRKFVLAMSEDIRVLLVKLADRTHNMRTLHFIKDPVKRTRIAAETLDIYAPLAERIGIRDLKDELENLAFAELHEDARQSILARLQFLGSGESKMVQSVIDELTAVCSQNGTNCHVDGRRKSPYSIWRKMQRKHASIEQLSDIMAFRVIVPSRDDCYRILGVIHGRYQVVPGRFKDYISIPKPNGYRSLHTSVIGPEQQRIEVQIRTAEMHDIAERGVAAHWNYKQGGDHKEGDQYKWIRDLLEILDNADGPEEFLEHTKLEMYADQVFCFTPKGRLTALPRGATPIDFAYAVHTELGDTCVGAKINGRNRPLSVELQNGDQVEIAVSKTSSPSPTWEEYCVTGKAKAQIRRFARQRQRAEFRDLGDKILEKTFRQEDVALNEKLLADICSKFQYPTAEDLIVAVGDGSLDPNQVLYVASPSSRPSEGDTPPVLKNTPRKSGAIPITGLTPGVAIHIASCCHPLPGERIVGIAATGKGVTIHTIDCEVLESFHAEPERWRDVAWNQNSDDAQQVSRLDVTLTNETGSMATLCSVLGNNNANILNLKITKRTADFFDLNVDIEVADVRHLSHIMAALRAMPVITSIDRARS
jgi:GTP pyrophosphokinase